jgi:hypothetical protein
MQPTFSNNKDRITYLLAEYSLFVGGIALGLIALAIYYQPSLPELPPWVPAVAVAWIALGFPCWAAGVKIYKWWRKRNWVTVHHINAVQDVREKYVVPPKIWKEKNVEKGEPHLVNDQSAFEVREFDWQPDIDQLTVSGTWMGEAKDSALVTDKKHMKAIHSYLLDAFESLQQLRATWSDQSIEMQGEIINSGAEARERGQLLDKTGARDVWEQYVDEPEMDEDPPDLIDEIEEQAAEDDALNDPEGAEISPNGDTPE